MNRNLVNTLFVVILVLFSSSRGLSQDNESAIAKLIESVDQVDQLFGSAVSLDRSQVDIDDYDISASLDAIDSWGEIEKGVKRSDSGLDISGGYDRKFGSGSDDPFDDYYSYANRFSLGLSWNILNSGFIGAKKYDDRVDLERDWKRLSENNYRTIEMVGDAYDQQCQIIDAHYNILHRAKIELYEDLLEFQSYLQSKGSSTILDQAELELQLAISRASLRVCDIEVDNIISPNHYIAEQTHFTQELLDSLLSENHILNEGVIEGELLDNEAQSINYWDSAKVAPYAKVLHYSSVGFFSDNRVVGQVGLTFTLPLLSGNRQKRREVQARAVIHENMQQQQRGAIGGELMQIIREINNNLQLLNISAKVVDTHREKIEVARQMYASEQLPLQKLTMQYLTLLDSKIKLLDLISERETLKSRLLLLNNRN